MKKEQIDPIVLQIKTLSKNYKNINRQNIRILHQFCQYDFSRTKKVVCMANDMKNPVALIEAIIKKPQLSEQLLGQLQQKYEKKYGPDIQIQTAQKVEDQSQTQNVKMLGYDYFMEVPADCITRIMEYLQPYSFFAFSITSKIHLEIGKSQVQSQYYKRLCTKVFKFIPIVLPVPCRFEEIKQYILQRPNQYGPNTRNAVNNSIRKFVWKMEMSSFTIQPNYYKSFGSYESLYKRCPRININGYYVCRQKYVRLGERNEKYPIAPIHIIYYYRYFRFLEDGTIMYHVRSKRLKTAQIIKFLSKNLIEEKQDIDVMIGEYIQYKDKVFIKIGKNQTIFAYQLQIRSQIYTQDRLKEKYATSQKQISILWSQLTIGNKFCKLYTYLNHSTNKNCLSIAIIPKYANRIVHQFEPIAYDIGISFLNYNFPQLIDLILFQFERQSQYKFIHQNSQYVKPASIEFKQQNILAMSDHEQSNDNQSFRNLAQCQQLKKQIALTSSQLIELTYSQCKNSGNSEKFNQKLYQFNKKACDFIDDEAYSQATVYLDQAQKILEYAAGCGKTIERSLITTILNNQACLLQRTSDFQQSANYLEAIIFNINDFLEGLPPVSFVPNITNCQSQQYADFSTYLQRSISLALYHLRFCALTSHAKNNELALKSAKKALNLLRQVTKFESNFEQFHQKHTSNTNLSHKSNDQGEFASIFKELSKIKIPESNSSEQFDLQLNKALHWIKIYKHNCENHTHAEIQQLFESYSIGNLMQACLLKINLKPDPREFIEKELCKIGKTYRVIHISMALFTVATQLRLISAAKYALDDSVRKLSDEYKESKIYHLLSIMLIAKFLPIKSVFYDHAIYSFKNHYGINLQEMADKYQENHMKKSQILSSKSKSQISVQNVTMEIHESRQNRNVVDQIIKNNQLTPRNIQIAQINNKNVQGKKQKEAKSKGKFFKTIPTQSTKTIESDRNTVVAHHSKNKENKSKSKMPSRGKDILRSRAKLPKNEQEEEQRKGIYYGFPNKSRSKSRKELGTQRKTSKKGLLSIKSGLVFQSKKLKNQVKVDEEYGVKTFGGFHRVTTKVKKSRGLRNSQTTEEQCQYLIKFNKVGNVEANMKKVRSPRNGKKETSRKKVVSKDKYNL